MPPVVFHVVFIGCSYFFSCLLYSGFHVHWMFESPSLLFFSAWGPLLPTFIRTHARMFDSKHMLKTNLAGVKFGKMPNASKESRLGGIPMENVLEAI